MLSPPRNASIASCVAEDSQAAPDFIPRGVQVERSGTCRPGDLFAEFFNSAPFFLYQLKDFAKLLDLTRQGLDLVEPDAQREEHFESARLNELVGK